MKHHITYEVNINGILYKNLTEEFRSEIIDFYFEVFLKGNNMVVESIIFSRLARHRFLDLGNIFLHLIYHMFINTNSR